MSNTLLVSIYALEMKLFSLLGVGLRIILEPRNKELYFKEFFFGGYFFDELPAVILKSIVSDVCLPNR